MPANTALPPGPAWPRALQSFAWWTRPLPFFERCRERYGTRFTLRLLGNVPIVNLTDPDEIREVFTAPPDVLHPGDGAGFLEPIVGRNSVILLDGAAHMRQRKLLLPAFHGDRMRALADLMTEVAEAEVAAWPREQATPLHPRLQTLTLDIILRAVFGLDDGNRLELLRERLGALLASAFVTDDRLAAAARLAAPSTYARFAALQTSVETDLRKLIDERRASAVRGRDVLAMLLDAHHEDGSPMSDDEILDELMTLLVAGHETTASGLAWAFALLVRTPAILGRVLHAIQSDDDAYLTAAIQETLRRRPVLPTAAPRLVKQPFRAGAIDYPPGVSLAANAYLVHHDPKNYADPYAFRPERFLDQPPGTYTWIPFGGGRRRCLGASFAQLEMKTVLRAVLGRWHIPPGAGSASPRQAELRRSWRTVRSAAVVSVAHRRPRGPRPGPADSASDPSASEARDPHTRRARCRRARRRHSLRALRRLREVPPEDWRLFSLCSTALTHDPPERPRRRSSARTRGRRRFLPLPAGLRVVQRGSRPS